MKSYWKRALTARMSRALLIGCIATAAWPGVVHAQSAYEQELITLARQSERHGNAVDAARLYEQLLSVNPNNQEAHHRLGVMSAARGGLDRAITHFSSALSCGAPTAQLLSDFGGALFLKGETDLAEQKLRAAQALDPSNVDVRNNLELVSAKQREKKAAAEKLLAVLHAKSEAEAAERAHKIAAARAVEETRAASEALAGARAATAARKIAEARMAAENQATAQALADAQAAMRARDIANARAAAAQQETSIPQPPRSARPVQVAQEGLEMPLPAQRPRSRQAPPTQTSNKEAHPSERRPGLFAPPPVPVPELDRGKSTLVIVQNNTPPHAEAERAPAPPVATRPVAPPPVATRPAPPAQVANSTTSTNSAPATTTTTTPNRRLSLVEIYGVKPDSDEGDRP